MTASRDIDDISTVPGGKSGAEWTSGTRESVLALWALNGGMLTDVAGTNTITANVAVSGGFTSYADGLRVGFNAAATNTGAATLNISSVGAKNIRDPDGDVLSAGAIVGGRFTEAVFYADDDNWRLVTSGGTTNVTVQGGLFLQRSAPSRLVSAVASTTSVTPIGSVSFQTQYADSRVIIEGAAALVAGAGSTDDDGIVVALYVDGVSVQSFTAYCLASQARSIPLYFSYLPGDISTHTYSVRVSSTIAAAYPASENVIWASEISPNA